MVLKILRRKPLLYISIGFIGATRKQSKTKSDNRSLYNVAAETWHETWSKELIAPYRSDVDNDDDGNSYDDGVVDDDNDDDDDDDDDVVDDNDDDGNAEIDKRTEGEEDWLTDLLPCRIPVHRLGRFGSFLYPRREFSSLFPVSCKFGDFDQIVGWLESKMVN